MHRATNRDIAEIMWNEIFKDSLKILSFFFSVIIMDLFPVNFNICSWICIKLKIIFLIENNNFQTINLKIHNANFKFAGSKKRCEVGWRAKENYNSAAFKVFIFFLYEWAIILPISLTRHFLCIFFIFVWRSFKWQNK